MSGKKTAKELAFEQKMEGIALRQRLILWLLSTRSQLDAVADALVDGPLARAIGDSPASRLLFDNISKAIQGLADATFNAVHPTVPQFIEEAAGART